MNTRSVEKVNSTSTYRQSLCRVMSIFLTGSLFSALKDLAPGWDGNLGWTLRQVIFQCILMTLVGYLLMGLMSVDWPHKKNAPPAGSPKIRPASKKERDRAKRSYEKKSAA